MEFKKTGKISTIVLVVVGVIGLLSQLLRANYGIGNNIEASHDFGRLNAPRVILIAWETFWLTSIALFFIWVAKRAVSGKSEGEVSKLENFEPKLFKIVITGLVIAAIGTLLLPAFIGPGLPHYRNYDDATVINVQASQFSFNIDGKSCDNLKSADPEICQTYEIGVQYNFNLTSTDTTHGFGLYDTDNVLILQAQIVPGYETHLFHQFDTPGEYTIRCIEYCANEHHLMYAFISVTGGSN